MQTTYLVFDVLQKGLESSHRIDSESATMASKSIDRIHLS